MADFIVSSALISRETEHAAFCSGRNAAFKEVMQVKRVMQARQWKAARGS